MFELSKMNVDDLVELKYEVEAAIKAASAEQKAAARRACEALAKDHGYTLDDLIDTGQRTKSGNGQKKPRNPGVPKYRNPFNPDQTWTGKGTRPRWFVAAVQGDGITPESMLI